MNCLSKAQICSQSKALESLLKSSFHLLNLYYFTRYLFDPEATANAHDSNGYFKTGDMARREGQYYFILGRAGIDSKLFPLE